jgi:transporter family-2 protein
VALVTVAAVFGQSLGSLAMDAFGLGPSGRHPLSPPRVLGAGLALTAVAIGALGTKATPDIGLLALAATAGAGVAVQSAAMGHMGALTGEPLAAAALNMAVGASILVIVALIATGGVAPDDWSAPAPQWLGGVIGATVAVILTRSVRTLGVLRLVLALVAGQSMGAVALDVIAPVAGRAVNAQTVLSVVLSLLALAISGWTWGQRKGARLSATAQ